MRAANIPCWIEAQRKMKWRLAVRIASHPEERWTKEAATWNPGPRIEAKASRRVGRPKKIRKDDINQFVKLDETEETRGSDLKNNDTWIRAAKDQKNMEGSGNRLHSDFFEGATTTTIQPKQLHTSHHRRLTTTHHELVEIVQKPREEQTQAWSKPTRVSRSSTRSALTTLPRPSCPSSPTSTCPVHPNKTWD